MTESTYRINQGERSIANLFSASGYGRRFEILPPQRRFKWKEPQVDQLWRDISNAYSQQRDGYFLGTLLVFPLSSDTVSVVDGQQRVTTVSLLLAVLRDHCLTLPEHEERGRRMHDFVARVDHGGIRVGNLVVKLQEPDNGLFISLVGERLSTASASGLPASRLVTALKRLNSHVEKLLGSGIKPASDLLAEFCDYVLDHVLFVVLEVANERKAYILFDTTNTRGLPLSPAESLKARLAAIDRVDGSLSTEWMERWNTAATKLENANLGMDPMDGYLRALLFSRMGYVGKKSLAGISSQLQESGKLSEFVSDIERYCDSYLAVANPTGTKSLDHNLRDLRHLNVQCYSFLTMVHKHSRSQFGEAVDLVLSLQIRNITVANRNPNTYEREWAAWAKAAREGRTTEAFAEMRNRMDSDEQFTRNMQDFTVDRSTTANHMLRRLDAELRGDRGLGPMEVEVEHILPKSVARRLLNNKRLGTNVGKWLKDLGYAVPATEDERIAVGKEIESWQDRLGNQALLNDKNNRLLGDSEFNVKKKCFGKQKLELTKELGRLDKWDIKQIKKRQERLAQIAPGVWKKATT